MRTTILWLAWIAVAGAASAQEGPPAGARIRVWHRCAPGPELRDCDRVVGALAAMRADSVVLNQAGNRLAIPTEAIGRTEVQAGTKGHFLEGAGIGLLAGTGIVFGYLALIEPRCSPSADDDNYTGGQCLGISGIVGGVPGLLVGGLVGSLIRTDRWKAIDRVRLSVAPRRDGMSVGARIAF